MNGDAKHFRRLLMLCPAALLLAWAIGLSFPVRVLTAHGEFEPLSPLYAFWMPHLSSRIAFPIGTGALYAAWVWFVRAAAPSSRLAVFGRFAAHTCWLAAFAVSLAAIRRPFDDLGRSFDVYPGEEFYHDVPLVESPGQFLRDFTYLHRHNRLSLHGKTHPPGHTLFLWGVRHVFGPGTQAAAIAILVVGATGLVPLCALAQRLFGARTASRVLVLFPIVPSIGIYAVSSADFLFAGIAAWSLWLAVEAVLGRSAVAACAAGALGGLAAMFSAAQVFVGLTVLVFAVAHWVDRTGTGAGRQLALLAVGLVFWFGTLAAAFGFNYLECLRLAHAFHRTFIAQVVGGLDVAKWLYTSLGNVFAFVWYLGLPVLAGACLSIASCLGQPIGNAPDGKHFQRAVWIVLGLMSFGGLFVLEVERIWLFLVGPIVVLACDAMPRLDSELEERRRDVWMVLVLGFQCVLFETLFYTIW